MILTNILKSNTMYVDETPTLALSPYQLTFYYEWMKNPLRNDYNLVFDRIITGDLCLQRLNQSLIRMLNDLYIWNSNVYNDSGKLYWKQRNLINENSTLINYYPHPIPDEDIEAFIAKPFNLEEDLIVRHYVLKLEDDKYRLIYILHHIIVDGLMFDELIDIILIITTASITHQNLTYQHKKNFIITCWQHIQPY